MTKDPNFDMMSGNDYTPSKRADAAVKTAMSGKSGMPDRADVGSSSEPAQAKMPAAKKTTKVPGEKTGQSGSAVLDMVTGV